MEELKATDGDILLCLSISKLVDERGSLYEATRKYWRLNINKAKEATHVLGIFNGKVVIVFNDVNWKYTNNDDWKGRIEFTSKQSIGIESSYIGKHIRMYGPIRFIK